MKKEDTYLFVKAVPHSNVMPVGAINQGQVQFIGKVFNTQTESFDILLDGVQVLFHVEYIKHIKNGSLLPVNLETALKAGVVFEMSVY